MRIIHACTGQELRIGRTFIDAAGKRFVLKNVRLGLLSACVTVWSQPPSPSFTGDVTLRVPIRYLHPHFPLQRVVFLS